MTNLEAFHDYIRNHIEEQLAYMEDLSETALVEYIVKVPGYCIETCIGDKLSLFKCNSTGKSIGTPKDVMDWLARERTEEEKRRWLE